MNRNSRYILLLCITLTLFSTSRCMSMARGQDDLHKEFLERIDGIRQERIKGYERLAAFAHKHGLWTQLEKRLQSIWALDPHSAKAEGLAKSELPQADNTYVDNKDYLRRSADLDDVLCELYVMLAEWCKQQSLTDELSTCVNEALSIQPHNKALRGTYRNERYIPGYGWQPKTTADHFKANLRLWEGEWVPVKEIQARRRQWSQAWVLETEHWQLTTNCKESIGIQVVEMLEAAHKTFVREFSDGFEIHEPEHKMKMNLFASKTAMIAKLKKHNPNVQSSMTQGNYSFGRGESDLYYYTNKSSRGKSNTFIADCIHEATHQMFDQLTEVSRYVGQRPNFWVIEGLADYVGQTFVYGNGEASIGSLSQLKSSSRWAYLRQNPAVYKTEDFALQTMADFMSGDVSLKYCQATTLTYYFMQGNSGKYRDRFIRYVGIVHTGDSNTETFTSIFGKEIKTIHNAYLKFLRR